VSDLSAIDFFDPRGRVNRKGLIVLAAILLGAQLGVVGAQRMFVLDIGPGLEAAINLVLLWIGLAGVSKRMHDLDVGAWHLLWNTLLLIIAAVGSAIVSVYHLGDDAMVPGNIGYLIVASVVLAPVVFATVWLHCAVGTDATNRFGPAPGPSGFSRGSKRINSRAMTVQTGAAAFN
jgi:uncharacterized membrane protein YhaH (DUF805 family)